MLQSGSEETEDAKTPLGADICAQCGDWQGGIIGHRTWQSASGASRAGIDQSQSARVLTNHMWVAGGQGT